MKWPVIAAIVAIVVIVAVTAFMLYSNAAKQAAYEEAVQQYQQGMITKEKLQQIYDSIGADQVFCNPFMPNTQCGSGGKTFSFGWGNIAGMF